MNRAGDPSPRSPVQAGRDARWERVAIVDGETYPTTYMVVVRHVASGELWAAVYVVRDDDSDADLPAAWFRVEPQQVTITKYRRVA